MPPVGYYKNQEFFIGGAKFFFQKDGVGSLLELGTIGESSPIFENEYTELYDSSSGKEKLISAASTDLNESYELVCYNFNLKNLSILFFGGEWVTKSTMDTFGNTTSGTANIRVIKLNLADIKRIGGYGGGTINYSTDPYHVRQPTIISSIFKKNSVGENLYQLRHGGNNGDESVGSPWRNVNIDDPNPAIKETYSLFLYNKYAESVNFDFVGNGGGIFDLTVPDPYQQEAVEVVNPTIGGGGDEGGSGGTTGAGTVVSSEGFTYNGWVPQRYGANWDWHDKSRGIINIKSLWFGGAGTGTDDALPRSEYVGWTYNDISPLRWVAGDPNKIYTNAEFYAAGYNAMGQPNGFFYNRLVTGFGRGADRIDNLTLRMFCNTDLRFHNSYPDEKTRVMYPQTFAAQEVIGTGHIFYTSVGGKKFKREFPCSIHPSQQMCSTDDYSYWVLDVTVLSKNNGVNGISNLGTAPYLANSGTHIKMTQSYGDASDRFPVSEVVDEIQ